MFIVLVGTKAQLVKMAPVIKCMDERKLPFKFVLTGQHAETMDDLIEGFGIREADDILVEFGESDTKRKLLQWLIAAWRNAKQRSYLQQPATAILVHGDTLSTLLGALIGRSCKIPVAHIEAGLRSFSLLHPFPEEITRLAVSRLSDIHYCPDQWSSDNLKKIRGEVINTGANTLLDSLRYAINIPSSESTESIPYAVVSMHRHENLANHSRLKFLIDQVINISKAIKVIFILHPVTRTRLSENGLIDLLRQQSGVELRERMNYPKFIALLSRANFLVSDGGSNQEEASYMQLPCLLLRKFTERQEGLDSNVVISHYNKDIISTFISKHTEKSIRKPFVPEIYPTECIVNDLQSRLI
jgi:UDP-N-acetylglucosamine 2-epimerase (non-hydrolysing)